MKLKSLVVVVLGISLASMVMVLSHAQQPTPAAGSPGAVSPGAAAPAQQPAPSKSFKPDAPAPGQEAPTCDGPDGKKHTFPLGVYDENADPYQTISDGLALAKSENKRVLAMWGENWCQFCLYLEDILAHDPACSPLVKSDYVWVRIDLGKGFSKNQAIAESFGVTEWTQRPDGKMMGAPSLCIIDPETGKTVGNIDAKTGTLEGVLGGNDMVAKPMTLSRLFDEKIIRQFLITWRPPAKPAQDVMNGAMSSAKRDSKKILALFTMGGDSASEKASTWMSRLDASAALGNAFVPVKIDTERMTGGREMLVAAAGKPVLPPFLCLLDAAGKPLNPPVQFAALPKTDAQIDDFIKALSGAAKIGDADKAVLVRSLKEAALAQAGEKK